MEEHALSHDTITRLKTFAETLRKPAPPFRLSQYGPVVFLLSAILLVGSETIKVSEIVKKDVQVGVLLLWVLGIMLVGLLLYAWWSHDFSHRHFLTKDQEIYRFLQWAELDITDFVSRYWKAS